MRILRGAVCLMLIVAACPAHAGWRSEGPFVAVVNDLAVDPSNPAVVYAATYAGGVWRSDDGGRAWTLPGNEMTSRRVRWVEVDLTHVWIDHRDEMIDTRLDGRRYGDARVLSRTLLPTSPVLARRQV